MNYKLYICMTIIIIIIIYFQLIINNKSKNDHIPIIWMYWEDKKGVKKPSYLDLCYKTVKRHCNKDFNIILLNEKSIYKYLPDLRKDLNTLLIPQKVDYIRYNLLYKYGGIWMDSDTIVLKSLMPIIDKLSVYDFVGFGCHDSRCEFGISGYSQPANWVMGAKKNSKLMKLMVDNCNTILDSNKNIKYHSMGRELLWKCISYLQRTDFLWNYYHFSSKCLERDSNYKKYVNKRMISNENIDEKCIGQSLFIPIYNSKPGFPNWFINMSQKNILNNNMLISKIFNYSLNN